MKLLSMDPKKEAAVIALVAAVCTFLLGLIFVPIDVDTFHYGLVGKPILDILQGKMLFKDSFFYFGILYPYFYAPIVYLFGASYFTLAYPALLMYAAIAGLQVLLWSRFCRGWVLWLSAALWVAHLPFTVWSFSAWPSVYALLMQILLLLCWFRYLEKGQMRWMYLGGLLIALAWGFRWTVGVFTASALLVFFTLLQVSASRFRLSKRAWTYAVSGFLLGTAILFSVLVLNGAVADWWLQTIKTKAVWATYYGSPIANNPGMLFGYYPLLQSTIYGLFSDQFLWKLLPLLTLFFTGYIGLEFWRKRTLVDGKSSLLFLSVLVVSLASWTQYFPLPCIRHMFWAQSLSFFLPALAAERLLRAWRYRFAGTVIVVLVVSVLLFQVGERGVFAWERWQLSRKFSTVTEPAFFKGMRDGKGEVEFFKKMHRILRLVRRELPDVEFLGYLRNPGAYMYDLPVRTFHQVFFDFNDVAPVVYADFVPRLKLELENTPAVWLMDHNKFIYRAFELVPDLKMVAKVSERMVLITNPAVLGEERQAKLEALLLSLRQPSTSP